ncbi:DUF4240 domain-containing protein [Synechococcus sp. PCC 6312]|uniref:DUF4240 domain-containing protein n=1 Tax=Synechococcus sp. (strain ATCC 27167 / PCC 6312) TaxID=195253 RepID=UPI00029EF4A1|nr:DUF4240 domain-containing protein [Synechococcus sp. PCC 6312]AFY60067.1 hypothetical protein Syn6312_0855 [Synechococcus sp. PCC 6312]
MEEQEFWAIIAASQTESGDCESQAQRLEAILSALPPSDIIEFDFLFRQKVIAAYRWDLWGIAYLVNGGCSDDSFDYFRYWLIGQGVGAYDQVLANPEAILNYIDQDTEIECESLIYASHSAYEALVGEAMPTKALTYPREPAGQAWEEETLADLFPQVAAQVSTYV